MRDVTADLRQILLAMPGLAALVGTRIWAKPDPVTGYRPDIDGPCITFDVRGGGVAGEHSCTLLPSVQYRCFGASEAEAQDVYLALMAALDNKSGDGVFSRVQTLGQLVRHPDTNWPFVFVLFGHTMSND